MNIYRGCTHGCIYCDSRSKCYQMSHDFEDIEVKENAFTLLENELKRKKIKSMIGTGAMCDPYIPLEQELNYTRKCLEVIEKYNFGVSILTKSNLILRDIDLLSSINQKSKCVVQMTLTTYDEKLCSIIEPNVCSTKQRFEVLKAMQSAGIPTIVWLMPILPYINDTADNLMGILEYCKDAKVWGILNFGFGLTLRDGDREYYYQALEKHFPGLKRKYQRKYGNAYVLSSDNHYRLMQIFTSECKKHQIVYDNKEIFSFLKILPQQNQQLSLFD